MMIKLLQLYSFSDLTDSRGTDYSGLWETIEVRGLADLTPMWKIRRVASFNDSRVGEEREVPQKVIEYYGNRIDRAALNGVPVTKCKTCNDTGEIPHPNGWAVCPDCRQNKEKPSCLGVSTCGYCDKSCPAYAK